MRQQNLRAVMMLVFGAFCWVPGVGAEPYLALYGGYSVVSDTELRGDFTFPGPPTLGSGSTIVSTTEAVRGVGLTTEVRNSAILGGKIGYWFDFFPFVGAELDISTFSPDITVPTQQLGRTGLTIGFLDQNGRLIRSAFQFSVSVVDIGIDIMGRYPFLQGPDFPRGRLQPYIGVGPALFVTRIDDRQPDPMLSLSSKSLQFGGFQVLGGVKFFLLKHLSLFAEYKFTHFTAELSGFPRNSRGGSGGSTANFGLSATQQINGSHFYGGVAYHFY